MQKATSLSQEDFVQILCLKNEQELQRKRKAFAKAKAAAEGAASGAANVVSAASVAETGFSEADGSS